MPFAIAAVAAAVVVNAWLVPLLLPPAAVAGLTVPRLGRLVRRLSTDPWGPSDPRIRRAAAHPALVVPTQSALFGALVAGLSPAWAAAAISYGIVAAVTGGMVLDARRRRTRLARLRIGVLPKALVQPPTQLPCRQPSRQPERHPGELPERQIVAA
jgi:hypothetical protein